MTATADAATIGAVTDVTPDAFGTPPQGARTLITREKAVVQDEQLETLANGDVAVEFVDGTSLLMGSNSLIVLDEFVYDELTFWGVAAYQLQRGMFFFDSGSLPKEGVRIETPTAIIGIRGTAFSVAVSESGKTTVSVAHGEVSVTSTTTGATATVGPGSSVSVDARGELGNVSNDIAPTNDPTIDVAVANAVDQATMAAEAAAEQAASAVDQTVSEAMSTTNATAVDIQSSAAQALSSAVSAAEQAASDAESAANQAASDAQSAAEQAASDAESAAEQAASEAQSAAEQAATDAESAAEQAASEAQSAAEQAASEAQAAAEQAVSDAESAVDDAVSGAPSVSLP
ncbi:MAG: FecR family protein [Rhodospirillales bacterium]